MAVKQGAVLLLVPQQFFHLLSIFFSAYILKFICSNPLWLEQHDLIQEQSSYLLK